MTIAHNNFVPKLADNITIRENDRTEKRYEKRDSEAKKQQRQKGENDAKDFLFLSRHTITESNENQHQTVRSRVLPLSLAEKACLRRYSVVVITALARKHDLHIAYQQSRGDSRFSVAEN